MDINELIVQGISYYMQRNYGELLNALNQAIYHDINCVQAYHYRGFIRWRQTDKQEALEDLQQAARLLNDREYTNRSKKLQIFIEQYCLKKTESLQSDNSEQNWIFHQENWFECYDDLVDAFPNEFMSSWERDLVRDAENCAEAYIEEEFAQLECRLSRRLKHTQVLQKKRIKQCQVRS
jgi:tetratricopeptide (TPR) repeat protein